MTTDESSPTRTKHSPTHEYFLRAVQVWDEFHAHKIGMKNRDSQLTALRKIYKIDE